MAPPANQKRRIQPQLIAADGGGGGAANSGINPGNVAWLGEADAGASDGSRPSGAWQPPSLREDAEFAAAAGMKGRRIHVELDAPSKDVNWRKLLKAQGVSAAQVRKQQKPAADPQAPPQQPGALPLAPRSGAAINPLANVIARLERQYVIPSDGESSSSEEAGEGEGEDADSEGQSGDESGTEQEKVNEGDYDYEDDFIDDSEFADFVGGDRRKPLHGGFFINKGEIEKGEEEVAFPDSPPKRPKRGKRPRGAASGEDGEGAGSGPDARRSKAKRSKKGPEDSEAGGRGGSGVSGAVAQSAPSQPASLAAQAAAAGAQAGSWRPAANGLSSDAAPAVCAGFSPAMTRALQEAAAAAAASEPEPTAGGGGAAIPKALNPALQPLACLLALEGRQQAGLRGRVLDEAARLCEHFNRFKLAKRLDSLAKAAAEDLEGARQKICDHIATRLAVADQRAGDCEVPPRPEAFPWDKNLEHHVLTFASLTNKVEGRWGSSADLREPLQRLLPLWPAGRMDLPCLQAALQRAVTSPRAHKALALRSLDSAEPPLAAAPAAAAAAPPPPPQFSPRTQAHAAQQPLSPPPAAPAVPAAAAAAAEPPQPAADTRPPEAIDPALEGLRMGADALLLSDSIKAANTTGRAIINKTLMCAGAGGYTTQEVLDKANALRLTGGEPWDKAKKATISNTIRAFKFTVHVGGNRYAHVAFPGVSEAAARETEAQEARRRLREEAAARAAAAAAEQAPIVLE